MMIAVFVVTATLLCLAVAIALGLRLRTMRRNLRTESRLPLHFWRTLMRS